MPAYTEETLRQLNQYTAYRSGLWASDVEKVNSLVAGMEALRQTPQPVPTDGDYIICVSPVKGQVSNNGILLIHGDKLEMCVHPSPSHHVAPGDTVPFSTGTSGSDFFYLTPEHLATFKFVEKRLRTFRTWGWAGPRADGAVSFQVEVSVWEFTSAWFDHC